MKITEKQLRSVIRQITEEETKKQINEIFGFFKKKEPEKEEPKINQNEVLYCVKNKGITNPQHTVFEDAFLEFIKKTWHVYYGNGTFGTANPKQVKEDVLRIYKNMEKDLDYLGSNNLSDIVGRPKDSRSPDLTIADRKVVKNMFYRLLHSPFDSNRPDYPSQALINY